MYTNIYLFLKFYSRFLVYKSTYHRKFFNSSLNLKVTYQADSQIELLKVTWIWFNIPALNWNPLNLPHVEIFEGMQFWDSWSKCCPDPHDTSYHLPKGDTESTTKHCLYNWHWPSRGSFLFSVQLPVIGLNICLWPVPYVGHLVATNLPSRHNW